MVNGIVHALLCRGVASELSSVRRRLHCVDDTAWWCSSSFPALALLLHYTHYYTSPTTCFRKSWGYHGATMQNCQDSVVNQQEFQLLTLHNNQDNKINIQEAMTALHMNSDA